MYFIYIISGVLLATLTYIKGIPKGLFLAIIVVYVYSIGFKDSYDEYERFYETAKIVLNESGLLSAWSVERGITYVILMYIISLFGFSHKVLFFLTLCLSTAIKYIYLRRLGLGLPIVAMALFFYACSTGLSLDWIQVRFSVVAACSVVIIYKLVKGRYPALFILFLTSVHQAAVLYYFTLLIGRLKSGLAIIYALSSSILAGSVLVVLIGPGTLLFIPDHIQLYIGRMSDVPMKLLFSTLIVLLCGLQYPRIVCKPSLLTSSKPSFNSIRIIVPFYCINVFLAWLFLFVDQAPGRVNAFNSVIEPLVLFVLLRSLKLTEKLACLIIYLAAFIFITMNMFVYERIGF